MMEQACVISPMRGIFSLFNFGLFDERETTDAMVGEKVYQSAGKESSVRLGKEFEISNIPASVAQNDPPWIFRRLRVRRCRRGEIE